MFLDNHGGYEYVSIACGGLFLVPQIIAGYHRGTLVDLSNISLVMILISSLLWSYYIILHHVAY